MDVVHAAWQAAGQPAPALPKQLGDCARCGHNPAVTVVREIVSANFTDFTGWADLSGRGLCAACAWAYRGSGLRHDAHAITSDPAELRRLDRRQLFEILAGGALSGGTAITVPTRAGRRHLLPVARWSRIRVDTVALPWSVADAERLHAVRRLRSLGFGPRMLTEAAPPWLVFSRAGAAQRGEVLRLWAQLVPWRDAGLPWLGLARWVTTATGGVEVAA